MLGFTRSSFISAAAIGVLILSAGCRSESTPDLGAYLPETGQANGWTKPGATRMYPADRLYEYIDGDADRYTKAGVQQVVTSDYRYRDKMDAVADVFVMRDVPGAAAVYESYSSNRSRPASVGDASRLYPGTLMFRRGRFFVRVVAYDEGPDVPDALLVLGRAIAERVK